MERRINKKIEAFNKKKENVNKLAEEAFNTKIENVKKLFESQEFEKYLENRRCKNLPELPKEELYTKFKRAEEMRRQRKKNKEKAIGTITQN